MKDETKVHIITTEDISNAWRFIKRGDQMVLWCQGNLSDNDSDDEAKRP